MHESGQLVIYFVVPLKSKAVREFVDGVMNGISFCLKEKFGIDAKFSQDKPGLWVENRKLCSVGFDLTQRVSMHGIALNVCNTLEGFKMIVPCGLPGVKMTTISKELGRDVTVNEVIEFIKTYF